MDQMTTKINELVIIGVVCLFFMSCNHGDGHKYHTIVDKIKAESSHYEDVNISSESINETIKTVEVKEGEFEFLIPERKSQITSYNCSECHTEPLDKLRLKEGVEGKKAHWDIKLAHSDDNTMNCTTCHTGNQMDVLHSLTNKKIDFNYSYKLCSQCHQEQFKDWKGGAHGKQLGGWAPPRLSNTCVNCHNPHKPHFEKRWPVRFNTQKVKERQ